MPILTHPTSGQAKYICPTIDALRSVKQPGSHLTWQLECIPSHSPRPPSGLLPWVCFLHERLRGCSQSPLIMTWQRVISLTLSINGCHETEEVSNSSPRL